MFHIALTIIATVVFIGFIFYSAAAERETAPYTKDIPTEEEVAAFKQDAA